MEIEWKGVGRRRIKLSYLRRYCPCAPCVDRRNRQAEGEGLPMLSVAEMTATDEVSTVVPVGRYAVQIKWSDGHDTGIYTYDYLRKLIDELGEEPCET